MQAHVMLAGLAAAVALAACPASPLAPGAPVVVADIAAVGLAAAFLSLPCQPVAVRAAVADMIRLIGARLKSVEEAELEDVQWHAQHIERDLDTFGRTAAYKVLRAQDKRVVIEFRREIGRIAARENAAKLELTMALRPFSAFVQSLRAVVNQRELLIAHDREVWASCGVKLERAEALAAKDAAAAAAAFEDAAKTAMALYGRDSALDAFLRKVRKGHLAGLGGGSLMKELEGLREILASLPMS
jgi:hypothetical protein